MIGLVMRLARERRVEGGGGGGWERGGRFEWYRSVERSAGLVYGWFEVLERLRRGREGVERRRFGRRRR